MQAMVMTMMAITVVTSTMIPTMIMIMIIPTMVPTMVMMLGKVMKTK